MNKTPKVNKIHDFSCNGGDININTIGAGQGIKEIKINWGMNFFVVPVKKVDRKGNLI